MSNKLASRQTAPCLCSSENGKPLFDACPRGRGACAHPPFKNLVVDSIESNVMSKAEAIEWMRKTEIVPVSRIVRSGQVLHVEGDLLLIGDVNPGGTVIAGGNIFILGALRGIAHAGYAGNKQAIIAASVMKPMQLRIGDIMSRAPDSKTDEGNEMECAYIDEHNQIVVDRLQLLMHLRPNLTRLERRM
ncbi:Septum site-determining protein MinC [Geobacillus sp. BCO2]|nr:Septum site-determining protein MinC [Geobacillus sp. BCO2]